MGRQEVVHSAWKRLQEAGLVISQDRLVGCEPVVAQNKGDQVCKRELERFESCSKKDQGGSSQETV